MSETVGLGPLTLMRDGRTWRFTLTTPDEMSLDIPRGYDREIHQQLTDLLEQDGDVAVVMDLEDIPAISSRQLGILLSLQKALRRHSATLPLAGTSTAVKHLLDVTRTGRFFTVE